MADEKREKKTVKSKKAPCFVVSFPRGTVDVYKKTILVERKKGMKQPELARVAIAEYIEKHYPEIHAAEF